MCSIIRTTDPAGPLSEVTKDFLAQVDKCEDASFQSVTLARKILNFEEGAGDQKLRSECINACGNGKSVSTSNVLLGRRGSPPNTITFKIKVASSRKLGDFCASGTLEVFSG